MLARDLGGFYLSHLRFFGTFCRTERVGVGISSVRVICKPPQNVSKKCPPPGGKDTLVAGKTASVSAHSICRQRL